MMTRAVLLLVLIVSLDHAMVHVYESSLPSIEQLVAAEYFPDNELLGKKVTGWLATCWRLPWGLGALAAGLLVDRYGARPMLTIYLFGCAAACVLAGLSDSLPMLFVAMFIMGSFACIYHPAGLALISHETDAANRPRALGLHGIFGSAGIGGAPFLAGVVLAITHSWRHYYWLLSIPGVLLGIMFLMMYFRNPAVEAAAKSNSTGKLEDDDGTDWGSYFMLTSMAMLMGFTYSAVLSFLPRYMDNAGHIIGGVSQESQRNFLAGGVLFVGCFGQYYAGRIARPERLERQLSLIMFSNIPGLLCMALAQGWYRVAAAALFALVHFMQQPIHNSLIAKYTPRRRRSLCYGFSFAMGLGFGSIGAAFVGYSTSDQFTYGTLAVMTTCSGLMGMMLWRRNRHP